MGPDHAARRLRSAWRGVPGRAHPRLFIVMACATVIIACGCTSPGPEAPADERRPAAKVGPLRRTTQEVLDLAAAREAGATLAEAAEPRQGLDAVSGAAVSSAATIGLLAVDQKMRLFEAEHGRKPATHAEFMERIIEKGGAAAVSLPALPPGQAYAFDPQRRAVVVVALPQESPLP